MYPHPGKLCNKQQQPQHTLFFFFLHTQHSTMKRVTFGPIVVHEFFEDEPYDRSSINVSHIYYKEFIEYVGRPGGVFLGQGLEQINENNKSARDSKRREERARMERRLSWEQCRENVITSSIYNKQLQSKQRMVALRTGKS